MSVGRNLQEMENVVTKGAAAAEPMHKLTTGIPDGQTGSWEDLGGPTPENYKSTDDSAKLGTPGKTLAQVKNVVNKGAKAADPMAKLAGGAVKEETDEEEELVDEEELEADEEVVAEAADEDEKEEEKGKKKAKKEEEEEDEDEMKEEFDIEEDVNALLEGEELSEEFQEKARTIFEAAIKTRVAEIKEQLQSSYEESLVEQVQSIREELTGRLDAYLEYVADEWIQENELAVEHGLKTEMTESFLQGMKGLFEDHYVTITEGLALSQKDKLASLAENVEFESEADYREKLVTLRESYFPSKTGTQRDHSENISEGTTDQSAPVSGLMESYLQTLNRVSKK